MKKFNTFEGVFTPTLLSILGVIMYLRLGWVVGQVGLMMALIVIIFSNCITLATALSMSSIVTNIRIGIGGAYSILTKSLGVEVGGAIGIPLYLSQAISVAFYIVGFSECWVSIFPLHNFLAVSLVAWFCILIVAYLSTALAFRIQYAIMGIIGMSLVSIFLGKADPGSTVNGLNSFKSVGFWGAFAIFFPAVTGVLVGATMSGELKNPRKSIPEGTLSAIGISFFIYVALAVWFSVNVSNEKLVNNTSILLEVARWKWLVLAGMMGATLSSALSMFVGAPRTLMALGKYSIVPFSNLFVKLNRKGEPGVAILFTALLSFVTLILGSLDSVASLLTMIFLITYGIINLSVFIEQSIGIASFRPSFKIPRIIPLIGGISCFAVMFLINITFTFVSFFLIITIYFLLLRKNIKIHSPDVRSGILLFVAEEFAKAAGRIPYHPKIWKPNLLISVEDIESFSTAVLFIRAVVFPSGRVFVYKIIKKDFREDLLENVPEKNQNDPYNKNAMKDRLLQHVNILKDENLFVASSVVESNDLETANITILETMRETFFPPNTFFYILGEDSQRKIDIVNVLKKAAKEGLGVIVLKIHPVNIFKKEKMVNLWIRKGTPNLDLSVLVALQLKKNWDGRMRIIQIVNTERDVKESRIYIDRLRKLMRLPLDVDVNILVGDFKGIIQAAPDADVNIFGMSEEVDFELIKTVYESLQTSVLFLRDSKHESALA